MHQTSHCKYSVTHEAGYLPCGQKLEKSRAKARAEYALIPLLESTLSTFLTLQEMNTLGQTNKTWKKNLFLDIKKYPYIDKPCSLFVAFHVRNLLRHSEKNPMKNGRLLELAKIEWIFKLTILTFPYVRHLHISFQDLCEIETLQDVINKIPMISLLTEEQLEITEKFSVPLMELPAFKQVVEAQVEGHGLAQLKNFTTLRSLKISTLLYADAEFAHVACLAGTLESLTFTSNVTNGILQALTQFTALKSLVINAPEVTDVGLNALSGLTTLRNLSFEWCPITGSGLKALSQLTRLQTLSFEVCNNITIVNVAQLAHLPNLQNLSLINTIFISNLRRKDAKKT